MEPCCVFDEEDEKLCRPWKVQRQVESHESGRYEYFEYSVHQWIHCCHVLRGYGWCSHGTAEMLKAGMLLSQPSVDHLRHLENTLEGKCESVQKHQVVGLYFQNEV